MCKGFSLSKAFNSVQWALIFLLFCEIHFEVPFLFEAITNCFVLFILCILRYNWFSFSLLTMLFHISPLRISCNMFWSSLPFFPNNSQILPVSHPCKLTQKKKNYANLCVTNGFLEVWSSLLGLGGCVQLPFPCWDLIWLRFAQLVCMQSQPPWVHMRSCIAMSRRHYFLLVNTASGSYILSTPSSAVIPEAWCEIVVPFRDGVPVSYSQRLGQLWISVNHHLLLLKEPYQMKAERCTHLWI